MQAGEDRADLAETVAVEVEDGEELAPELDEHVEAEHLADDGQEERRLGRDGLDQVCQRRQLLVEREGGLRKTTDWRRSTGRRRWRRRRG